MKIHSPNECSTMNKQSLHWCNFSIETVQTNSSNSVLCILFDYLHAPWEGNIVWEHWHASRDGISVVCSRYPIFLLQLISKISYIRHAIFTCEEFPHLFNRIPVSRGGTDISDIGCTKNIGYQLQTTDMPSLSLGHWGTKIIKGITDSQIVSLGVLFWCPFSECTQHNI